MCWVETVLGSERICGKLRRKDGFGWGKGCDGPCKWSEVMCGRLGRNGGRNCAQNSREGRDVGMMLREVSIEIDC